MRSLLSPAPAEESVVQPVTVRASTEALEPASPRPLGPGQSNLQGKLYETTERLAIALMERAEKDLLAPSPDGKGPSVRELQQVVDFAMGLLVKLPKLKPEDDEEDAGVDILRAAMTDPGKVVDRLQANPKFISALRAKGWLPPPAKVSHRPTREQVAHRQEYAEREKELGLDQNEDDDDSVLQGMLKGQTQ